MLISMEAQQAYLDVLAKAQAYQICASVYVPVDFKSLQAELVSLYKFKLLNDEVEVRARVQRVNSLLDRRMEACTNTARQDIMNFIEELKSGTPIYSKLDDISTKLSIIQATINIAGRGEEKSEVHKPSPENPVKAVVSTQKKSKKPEPLSGTHLKKKCVTCQESKNYTEFYGNENQCKKCTNKRKALLERKRNRTQWLIDHKSEYALVRRFVDSMPIGECFTLNDVASKTGVRSYNNVVVFKAIAIEVEEGRVNIVEKKERNSLYERLNY